MSTTLTADAAAELAAGLARLRAAAGLTTGEPQLMRYTINAVYRIGDHVLRMGRGEVARRRAERVVAATELLRRHGVPTVELVADVAQPLVVDDWSATVWHYLPHPAGRPPAVDLVAPLQLLHAIAEAPEYLPRWAPIDTARRRLQAVLNLPTAELTHTRAWADHEVGMPLEELVDRLAARCDELADRVQATTWPRPPGVIHGDAHVGNVLAGRLCDFDSVSIGPREWDLVPLAHSAARFGDPREPYAEFAAAYGFDLAASPVWPVLRDVREMQLVTSVLDKLTGRPEVALTLGHRLRTYLADDREAIWERYR